MVNVADLLLLGTLHRLHDSRKIQCPVITDCIEARAFNDCRQKSRNLIQVIKISEFSDISSSTNTAAN
jgi:hypothetical protein